MSANQAAKKLAAALLWERQRSPIGFQLPIGAAAYAGPPPAGNQSGARGESDSAIASAAGRDAAGSR